MNLNDSTSVSGLCNAGGGEALLDECTGHLFSAHVHYVIGFKNWWLLVSQLLNGSIHLHPQTPKKQIGIGFDCDF